MGARINFPCMPNNRGRKDFDLKDKKLIAVINPEEGYSAGLVGSQGSNQNELPREELDSMELANSEKKYARKLLLIGQQLSLTMILRKLL